MVLYNLLGRVDTNDSLERAMTHEQVAHFHALGFLQCRQLFSREEMGTLSAAFDAAMSRARGGAPAPGPGDARQQVAPFFDYDPEVFYPLLDDDRLVTVFAMLMGEDFIFLQSEGLLHTAGSRWHHDARGPEGIFSMRAAIYLDPLRPGDGCLDVIPGSHFMDFGDALKDTKRDDGFGETLIDIGVAPEDFPGRYSLVNELGDVIFMNHKVYHAALSNKPGRRAIHVNCVQNTTLEKNREHYDWLIKILDESTTAEGRFYSDRLIETAGPRRRKMMARAIELGYGTVGPITHLQEIR